MINGTYRIIMKTLMGKKNGLLILKENNHSLMGFVDILEHRTEIQNGVLINGKCRFSGEFVTPVRIIAFTAEGSIDERHISLNIRAGLLNMEIIGERDTGFEKGK